MTAISLWGINVYGYINEVWGHQDGWILAIFFFCEFMDLDSRPLSSNLDWASLVNKGLIIWFLVFFFLAGHWVVPSRQDRATLKAGMTERRNHGITEPRKGGKWPQILKDRIAERRNGGKSPQILKDGIAERRNDGKYPKILKDGMTENTPKS